MSGFRVAVDIGGTFTDVVVYDDLQETISVAKVPSTAEDLSRGVLSGVQRFLPDLADVSFFVHGTTAGLNAFLTRRGALTGLITTAGFRDVYEIGRGNRPDMYNLHYRRPKRLLPRRHVFEVAERVRHDGSIEQPLDETGVATLIDEIAGHGFDSIAVCLLHAYANPAHELRLAELLHERLPGVSISLSHRVAPEWREYERTSTTVMNAYIAPVMDSYLSILEERSSKAGLSEPVYIMQSTGGLLPSWTAKQMAVQTIMSGPVGGAVGGAAISGELGHPNLLCVDMGGTSFDMSLIVDGKPDVRTEAELEGFPLLMPMVDIHTIGAGGGSIAWIEAGGLRVGPQSAGAKPGPACYGRGGTQPTVTDANLVLGRVDPSTFLGGRMTLDRDAAVTAMQQIGSQLGLDEVALSEGICAIVNANMAGAIRQITIERGIDPREFALVAFGGAGPMHALFIARELEIPMVVIPRSPGAFSAWGMLQTDLRRDFVRTFYVPVDDPAVAELHRSYEELEAHAKQTLIDEQTSVDGVQFVRNADLRYVGQEHFLSLNLADLPADGTGQWIADRFHAAHQVRYGHNNPRERVEIVNLRLAAIVPLPKTNGYVQDASETRPVQPHQERDVVFDGESMRTGVFFRDRLVPGDAFSGPAIMEEPSCTTVIPPGYQASVDASTNVVIRMTRQAD